MAAPIPAPSELQTLSATSTIQANMIRPLLQQNTSQGQVEGEQQAGPSGLQTAGPLQLEGVSIPEGVDPSFLDALPEDIR